MDKTIVIFKHSGHQREETKYLKEQIEMQGCQALIIDLGTRGEASIPADITREEVLACCRKGY